MQINISKEYIYNVLVRNNRGLELIPEDLLPLVENKANEVHFLTGRVCILNTNGTLLKKIPIEDLNYAKVEFKIV